MVRFNHAAAVRMYTRLVKAGRRTLDEVPEEYRARCGRTFSTRGSDVRRHR